MSKNFANVDHRIVAVYARNPATVLHPILRTEVVKSLNDFRPFGDDDAVIDITDHPHGPEIDNTWCLNSETGEFVKGS